MSWKTSRHQGHIVLPKPQVQPRLKNTMSRCLARWSLRSTAASKISPRCHSPLHSRPFRLVGSANGGVVCSAATTLIKGGNAALTQHLQAAAAHKSHSEHVGWLHRQEALGELVRLTWLARRKNGVHVARQQWRDTPQHLRTPQQNVRSRCNCLYRAWRSPTWCCTDRFWNQRRGLRPRR